MNSFRFIITVCFASLILSACHASNADNPSNSAPDQPTQSEKKAAQTAAAQADDSNYVDPNAPAVVVTDSAKLAKEKKKN
jgi:ABC-type enterochelin transport system substrate-binding protein